MKSELTKFIYRMCLERSLGVSHLPRSQPLELVEAPRFCADESKHGSTTEPQTQRGAASRFMLEIFEYIIEQFPFLLSLYRFIIVLFVLYISF